MAAAFLRRLQLLIRALVVLLLAAVIAAAAGAGWLLVTQAGLDWALAQAMRLTGNRLSVEGAKGALARRIEFDRIAWRDGDSRLALEQVSAQLSLPDLLAGTVRLDGFTANRARIAPGGGGAKRNAPPASLAPPLRIRLADAAIADLTIEPQGSAGSAPLRFSSLRFEYAGGETVHRLREFSAATPWGRVALDATMATAPPFAIDARGALERPEGRLRVRAALHPFADIRVQALEAQTEALDLAAIDARLPQTRLAARFEGAGAPDALLQGALTLRNPEPGPLDRARLPLNMLSAQVALRDDRLVFDALQAQAAGGRLTGEGSAAPGEAQLKLKLSGVDLQAVRSNLRKTALSGALDASLAPERQALRGTLAQDDLKLFADAVRQGERIDIRALRAEAAGGVATGTGEVRLGQPPQAKGALRFSGFDPSRFGAYPAGSLTGSATVSGTLGATRRLAAQWTVARSTLAGKPFSSSGQATLEGERVHGVEARAQWDRNRLSASGALGAATDTLAWTLDAAALPVEEIAGRLAARGTLQGRLRDPLFAFTARVSPIEVAGRFRAREFNVAGKGTLGSHQLDFAAAGADFDLAATLGGGRHGADGWRGSLRSLTNRGRYPLALEEPVPLAASPREVQVGRVRAKLADGRIDIARVDWRPGRLESAGQFSGLPGAWLVAAAGAGERLRSTLLLEGRWTLASTPALEGTLSVRRSAGDLALIEPVPLELGLTQALLEAQFDAGRVRAHLQADGRIGSLDARASASGLAPGAALQAEAEARLADLRVLAARLPPSVRVGGNAVASLSARGTLEAPVFAGSLRASQLSVHLPPYGVYLEDGALRASLAGDVLRVDALELRGGDGRLSASGALPLTGNAAAAQLQWQAKALQLVGRPDLRLVVSGGGEAGVDAGRAFLRGKIAFDSGYVERSFEGLPQLDDDIVVAGRAAEKPAPKADIPLDLAMQVDLGTRFRVREAGFDGLLRGEVRVATGPGGELRAFGRIRAADATYRAYGRTLAVNPGEVTFDGPVRNPALRIEAWRRNQEVAAGVRISGNLQQPRVELISEPPLPEGAKLSWLVLGRAPSDAAGADLALLQAAAGAMLGRGDKVPLTTRIADRLGLDEIGLRGSSQIESRVLAVGKRLSDRLYLTYEQGLGTAAQNLVKIDLSLSDRISLRAQTGSSSGAGVYYRYAWD